ncbi:MAG: stage II sporulation protein M [Candidatus Hydrogenedens sp.]|nr:stage II sporulation protein M [Candidatus Hydrogenedens sp.]
MIVDIERFVENETPYWRELEGMLDSLERDSGAVLHLDEARRLHYLYQRASSALARVNHMALAPQLRETLEPLVTRAYTEIHQGRRQAQRLAPFHWFFAVFPQTFRRQGWAFWLALGATLAGCAFGVAALALDPDVKPYIMPFPHLLGDPSDRVAEEEQAELDDRAGSHAPFAAMLMTHNTKVSMMTLALGVTFGIGTLCMLFYNGVILGAVAFDYIRAGEGVFLSGWLLPHGSVEIPAIILAGQAGLVLGRTLIGWGTSDNLRSRLRKSRPDIVTLIFGAAIVLIWAGIVESFFSQYHEPVVPYAVKILFGTVQLVVFYLFLGLAGRGIGLRWLRRDAP